MGLDGEDRGFSKNWIPFESLMEGSPQPELVPHYQPVHDLFIGPLEDGEIRGSITEHLSLGESTRGNIVDSSLHPITSPANKLRTSSSRGSLDNIDNSTKVIKATKAIMNKNKDSLHNSSPPQSMVYHLQDPQAEEYVASTASTSSNIEATPTPQHMHSGDGSDTLPTSDGKKVSLCEVSVTKGQHDLFMGSSEEDLNSSEQQGLALSKITIEAASNSANEEQLISYDKADTIVSIHSSVDSHHQANSTKNNQSNHLKNNVPIDLQDVNKAKNVNLTKASPPQALITGYLQQITHMDQSPAQPVPEKSQATPPAPTISETAFDHPSGATDSEPTKGEFASLSGNSLKAPKLGVSDGLVNENSNILNIAPSIQPASGPVKVDEAPEEGELIYEEGEVSDDDDPRSASTSLIPLANQSSITPKDNESGARFKSNPLLKKPSPKSKKGKRTLYRAGLKPKKTISHLLAKNDPSQTKIVDSFSPRSRSRVIENSQARSRSGSLKSGLRSPADVPTAKYSKREQAASNSPY